MQNRFRPKRLRPPARPTARPAARPIKKYSCVECGREWTEDDIDINGFAVEDMNGFIYCKGCYPKLKKCRYCAEVIQYDAKTCRFCGNVLYKEHRSRLADSIHNKTRDERNYSKYNKYRKEKDKSRTLGTVAIVFSFIPILGDIAFILALIYLCIGDDKGYGITALLCSLIIPVIWLFILFPYWF